MMNKSALVLLCMVTASYAMEDTGLYLVVGSTRNNKDTRDFITEQLWQEKKADLSHTKTYDGKATTMDIQKSVLPGVKHIMADICRYEFENNFIRAAYLERLPTLNIFEGNKGLERIKSEKSYLGTCIQNVGNAMVPNAVIEIEWHPYLRLTNKGAETVTCLYDEKRVKKDPFTITIDRDLAWNSVGKASTFSFDDGGMPEQFITCVKALSEKIEALITFYEKKNVAKRELLKKRLWQEKMLVKVLTDHKAVLLSNGPEANLEEFFDAVNDFLAFETEDDILEMLKQEPRCFVGSKLYDLNSFLAGSLYSFILCDASIEHYSPYVKEFMLNNGFKDVTIKRTQSSCNGRENVWIITGVKA